MCGWRMLILWLFNRSSRSRPDLQWTTFQDRFGHGAFEAWSMTIAVVNKFWDLNWDQGSRRMFDGLCLKVRILEYRMKEMVGD